MSNLVTCNQCGWVHFAISYQKAHAEVKRFNKYFDTLSKKQQVEFYGGKGSSIEQYTKCMLCGGSKENFRKSKKGDVPMGCTVNPIIRSSK